MPSEADSRAMQVVFVRPLDLDSDDIAHLEPQIPFAIAILILALAAAYFLVKRAQAAKAPETQS